MTPECQSAARRFDTTSFRFMEDAQSLPMAQATSLARVFSHLESPVAKHFWATLKKTWGKVDHAWFRALDLGCRCLSRYGSKSIFCIECWNYLPLVRALNPGVFIYLP